MSTILITGGAGYIGSHAAYAFRDAGYDVVVLDDLSTGVRKNLARDVPLVVGDVGDATTVARVLQEYRPAGVLHFAGSIVVPESVADPLKYYRNNTVASLTLFETCLRHGIERIVFSSTAAVYGIPENGIADESAPLRPVSPYGWSKLTTEQMLADLAAAHGLSYAALRYFNVAGADPHGRTGQSTPQATHLIKIACQVALGRRPRVSIFGTDYQTRDGTCVRDFVHVSDLAKAHRLAYEHIAANSNRVVFNCGSGRGHTVREVLATLEKVTGRPVPVVEAARRPGDPPILIAEASAIRRALGWQPRHDDLAAIIETALRWEQFKVSTALNERDREEMMK